MMWIMKDGKRKLKVGECLLLWKRKTGTCIFGTLTVQAREAIFQLDPDTLPVDSEVENLIKLLDNLHLKN